MGMAKQAVLLTTDPAGQHMPYACASEQLRTVFS